MVSVDMVVVFRGERMMKRAWFYHRIAGREKRGHRSGLPCRVNFGGSVESSILESKFLTRIECVADYLKETGL